MNSGKRSTPKIQPKNSDRKDDSTSLLPPPHESQNQSSKRLSVCVSPEQMQNFDKLRKPLGLSRSMYCTRIIMHQAQSPYHEQNDSLLVSCLLDNEEMNTFDSEAKNNGLSRSAFLHKIIQDLINKTNSTSQPSFPALSTPQSSLPASSRSSKKERKLRDLQILKTELEIEKIKKENSPEPELNFGHELKSRRRDR